MKDETTCPGCGLKLKAKELLPSNRFNASGACYKLFTELSGYTLSNNDKRFMHQLIVDAYSAQHAGGNTKNITVIFALIGLCLVIEHQYTGRQVQLIHMKIKKHEWPRLEPPKLKTKIRVNDILAATNYNQMEPLIYKWVEEVWESWKSQHNFINSIIISMELKK